MKPPALRSFMAMALVCAAPSGAAAHDFSITSSYNGYYSDTGSSNMWGQMTTGRILSSTYRAFYIFELPDLSKPLRSVDLVFQPLGESGGSIPNNLPLSVTFFPFHPHELMNLSSNNYHDLGLHPPLGSTTVFFPGTVNPMEELSVSIYPWQLDYFLNYSNFSKSVYGTSDIAFGVSLEHATNQYLWGNAPAGSSGGATLNISMVPEINGSGFAYIAFILGALGLWLYSGAGAARDPEAA